MTKQTQCVQDAINSGRVLDILKVYVGWYFVRVLCALLLLRVVSFAFPAPEVRARNLILPYLSPTCDVVALVFVILYLKRFCRRRGIALSERFRLINPISFQRPSLFCYTFCATLLVLSGRVALYMVGIHPSAYIEEYQKGFSSVFLVGSVITLVVAPVTEELIWRGFAYPIIRERIGISWGIVITSLAFTAVHFTKIRSFPLAASPILILHFFLFGALLNIIYEREENLKYSILFHSLVNILILATDFWL